jgi:hypothetical protein
LLYSSGCSGFKESLEGVSGYFIRNLEVPGAAEISGQSARLEILNRNSLCVNAKGILGNEGNEGTDNSF